MTNMLRMPEDWSAIKKLIWLKAHPAMRDSGVEKTVSGNAPLAFSHAKAAPLINFTTNIMPVQDLHGYDAPWPAGGGKNKLPNGAFTYDSRDGVTFAWNSNGTVTINGTPTNTIYNWIGSEFLLKAGTYTISPTGADNTYLQVYDGGTLLGQSFPDSGTTFTIAEDANVKVRYQISTGSTYNNKILYPQIETGSAFTSFAPYENICPISGTDKVTVWTDSKYGGLVEWNQIFPTRTINYSGTGFTITSDNNGVVVVTVTTDGTSENNAHNHTAMSIPSSVNGHKCILLSGSSDVKVQLKATSTESDVVFTATAGYNNVAFMFNNLSIGTYNVYPMLCDLTAMFGAGNEPATVEAFRALFPLDFYVYDTGTRKTVDQVNGSSYTPVTITFPALGKNLYNKNTVKENYYLDSEGTETFNAAWSISEYIPCVGSRNYTISGYYIAGNAPRSCWYDKDKAFISSFKLDDVQSGIGTTTVQAPENAQYLRMSIQPTYKGTTQLELSSSASSYEPYTNTLYGGTVGSDGGENGSAVIILDGTQSINNQKYDGAENIVARWNLPTGKGAKTTSTGSLPLALCETMKPISNTMIGNFSSWSSQADFAYSFTIAAEGNRVGIALPQSLGITNNTQLNAYLAANPIKVVYDVATQTQFAVTAPPIPTTKGDCTLWATAEDGTVDSMSVTYKGHIMPE